MIGCNMEALPLSEYGSFIRVEPYPRPRPAADEAECDFEVCAYRDVCQIGQQIAQLQKTEERA